MQQAASEVYRRGILTEEPVAGMVSPEAMLRAVEERVERQLQAGRFPVLLVRTPYGISPYGEAFRGGLFPGLYYDKENYIIVLQDIRGRSMSEGTFEYQRPYIKNKKTSADVDESSDAYDTVEWMLASVPEHNGRGGVWGSSYPGFTAAMAAIPSHPAVKAVSPQAPMADLLLLLITLAEMFQSQSVAKLNCGKPLTIG